MHASPPTDDIDMQLFRLFRIHRPRTKLLPAAVLGVVLSTLGACSSATGPVDPQVVGFPDGNLFYYVLSERIYVNADWSRIVVEGRSGDIDAAIEEAGAAFGFSPGPGSGNEFPGRRVVHTASMSETQARQFIHLLRRDPRAPFVSPEYRTREGNWRLSPSNSLSIEFHDGTDPMLITRLFHVHGLVLHPTSVAWTKNLYRVFYPRGVDPLSFTRGIHELAIVKWAAMDGYSDIRPGASVAPTLETPHSGIPLLPWRRP